MNHKLIDRSKMTVKDRVVYDEWKAENRNGFMRSGWYQKVYLQTDHWQRVRAEMVSFWEGCCALSDKHVRLPMNAHHRNYKHLWEERWCDVILLCKECHEYHHLFAFPKQVTDKAFDEVAEDFMENVELYYKANIIARDELYRENLKQWQLLWNNTCLDWEKFIDMVFDRVECAVDDEQLLNKKATEYETDLRKLGDELRCEYPELPARDNNIVWRMQVIQEFCQPTKQDY